MENWNLSPFQELWSTNLSPHCSTEIGTKWGVVIRSLKAATLIVLLHLFADLEGFLTVRSSAPSFPAESSSALLSAPLPVFRSLLVLAVVFAMPSAGHSPGRHSGLSTYQSLFMWARSEGTACIASFRGEISLAHEYFCAFTPRCLFFFAASLVFLPHQAPA